MAEANLRDDLRQAARKLSGSAITNGFRPQAVHEYSHEDGTPIFWKVRLKKDTGEKWIRPIYKDQNTFRLGEAKTEGLKPLYRVPQIIASDDDEPVYVVEGELAADALISMGMVATTSGGASSAGSVSWAPLFGRDVVLWSDCDDAGIDYVAEVAEILKGRARSIRLIDVQRLGLPEKGDAADWVSIHPQATPAEIGALPSVELPKSRTSGKRPLPDGFSIDEHGVYFDAAEERVFVCGPLSVLAKTRDTENCGWGRMLEWRDDDGVRHRWIMPMDLLEGDSLELRRELARRGLKLPVVLRPSERHLLQSYLKQHEQDDRLRVVDQTGWHNKQYVTPSKTFGGGNEKMVFYPLRGADTSTSSDSSLNEWITKVSLPAIGNSKLAFVLSAAFGAPALELLNEPSGGFHLIGKSSSGKSTLLLAAASVWSRPADFIRTWRSTSNGLESVAASLNDNLLILDELSQCDPREAGAVAYMLANGQGKIRANKLGGPRMLQRWRLLFLSNGEESLSGLISSAGKTTKAGQEIRLAEFDADAGKSMGVFEHLGSAATAADFARQLALVTAQHYGIAGPCWVKYLVENYSLAKEKLQAGVDDFMSKALQQDQSSQKGRVARRFAAVAAAGELATEQGLTGWSKGTAMESCLRCFNSWNERFGEPQREEQSIKQAVRTFLELHGASRFDDMDSSTDRIISNRAGFYRVLSDGGREYRVFTDVFRREICVGADYRTAEKYLVSIGWLRADSSSSRPKERLPGFKNPQRIYSFTDRVWIEE